MNPSAPPPPSFVVLRYLQDPGSWYDRHGIARQEFMSGGRRTILDGAQLPVSGVTLDVVLADLGERRLANVGGLSGMVTGTSMWDALALPLGDQLVDVVTYIEPAES